jgi:hypothetical protein
LRLLALLHHNEDIKVTVIVRLTPNATAEKDNLAHASTLQLVNNAPRKG